MLDRCNQIQSLLFGWLACLAVTGVVDADGRLFVLDLRNSSGLWGFRDAEQACASRNARLASAEELRHAVAECFFSPCVRGWLHGGTVGTTVCDISLKAVDVRTENATEDSTHLDVFCIKDKAEPCGDPPSFPNARLQGHPGFEMGDELLYTCVPGYVMPNGQGAFSLLCDSCGEWYGLVQICVKDESEIHLDYEDKFTDSYGEAERHEEKPEEARVYEEVDGAAYPEGKMSQEQKETSFRAEEEERHRDQHGEQEVRGEVIKFEGAVDRREKDEEQAVQDFTGHPSWEQESREVVKTDAAAPTEAPVSLLSQKHMFWFPSEAFQEEELPVLTNPVTQTTQRASGAQSEESKEQESQERHQYPVETDNHERDSHDDRDDHHDHHDDRDDRDGHNDRDDHDSHQDEDDRDDHIKHYIPAQHDDLNRQDSHEKHDDHDHDDHYDMGEREDDRVPYGSQEYDDHGDHIDTYGKRESHEDHEDMTGSHDDQEHPRSSEEHLDRDDHDDVEEHYDLDEDEDDNDHDHDDHESYEDDDDVRHRVIFSIDQRQNTTQKKAGGKTTTDETWLDGYPVVPEETEKDDSTSERARSKNREWATAVRTTDRPNEVEIHRPVESVNTRKPELDQGPVEEVWPGLIPTAAPFPGRLGPSDSPSYSDTLDYDTQQAAPTPSWMGDLTEQPFLDHGVAPPVQDGDILTGVTEEHTMHSLPGETGERGEVGGERGEAMCTGENCPPHPPSSSSQGPKVAAIIVAVCAVAAAVIVVGWCYRRQQQKSSMYEMNGKGQSQSRQGQHIEMQQKV